MNTNKVLEVFTKKLHTDLVFGKNNRINTYSQAFTVFEGYAVAVHKGCNYSSARRKQIIKAFYKETGRGYNLREEFDARYIQEFINCCCKHYYLQGVGGSGEQIRLTEFFMGEIIHPN